jgi:hypothetical protein
MKRSIFLKTFGGYLLIIVLLVFLVLVTAFGFIRSRFLDSQASDQEKIDRRPMARSKCFFWSSRSTRNC